MVCIYTEYFASECETAAMRFSTNVCRRVRELRSRPTHS